MKAIGVHGFGGPDVLRVLDPPEPQAGLVRSVSACVRACVRAAAVSSADALLRTGGHAARVPGRRPPFVPGMDAAGGGYAVELAEADGLVIADAAEQTTGIVPPTGDGGALAELRGWSGPVERDIRVYSVMAPDRTNDTVGLDAHCCQAEKGVLTLRVAEVLPLPKQPGHTAC